MTQTEIQLGELIAIETRIAGALEKSANAAERSALACDLLIARADTLIVHIGQLTSAVQSVANVQGRAEIRACTPAPLHRRLINTIKGKA